MIRPLKLGLCFLLAILVPFPGFTAEQSPPKRPFFEYKGNYAEEVQTLKDQFKQSYGYDLVNLGQSWTPQEIKMLRDAFAGLPPVFYRLKGLKALYRLERIVGQPGEVDVNEVPAATLPSFMTVYRRAMDQYQALVDDQELRVEFYNPLFYEDKQDFFNIVHHEMAHAFDLANGFLSFSPSWLELTRFRTLHLLALDGKPDSDFLFTMLNDPAVDNYAPVADRHLPTYSRQNSQEDFANSVAAYIHYPYFQYSHPKRYQYLKEKVFDGKEYFPADPLANSLEEKIFRDFERALKNKDWDGIRRITGELGRSYFPEIEKKLIARFNQILENSPSAEMERALAHASCFLYVPQAYRLRKELVRNKRVAVETLLQDERCFRMGRKVFEADLVKWPPENVFFYRENGNYTLQFMDSVLLTSHSRGYGTRYFWRIFLEGEGRRPLAEGSQNVTGGTGSVKLILESSRGGKLVLPEGRPLILELGVLRSHSRTFKSFESSLTRIRFVDQPWFNYLGPNVPKVRVVFPLGSPLAGLVH